MTKHKKEIIAIHGSYYCMNFGDTLIISIIKNWVNEIMPDSLINLPFVNSKEEGFQIMNGDEYITDPSLKNTKALIFGPGGYFGEPNSSIFKRTYWYLRNFFRHLYWNKKLFKNNIPYMIVGVGVGPIKNFLMRKKIIKLFKNAQFIAVRDKLSKQYLVSWGVPSNSIEVTKDVALTTQRNTEKQLNNKLKVGIHFSGDELTKYGKMDAFILFVKYLITNYDVFLVEDEPNQSKNYRAGTLFDRLKNENIIIPSIDYKSPELLLNDLQKFDCLITSKLHVGILGYSFLIPVLSVPKHQKTQRFYKQIGRSEFCLDFKSLETKFLIKKFEKCINSKISKNELKTESLKNKELIIKFIKNLN